MFSAIRQASRSGSFALRAAHRATPVACVSRPTLLVRTLISESTVYSRYLARMYRRV